MTSRLNAPARRRSSQKRARYADRPSIDDRIGTGRSWSSIPRTEPQRRHDRVLDGHTKQRNDRSVYKPIGVGKRGFSGIRHHRAAANCAAVSIASAGLVTPGSATSRALMVPALPSPLAVHDTPCPLGSISRITGRWIAQSRSNSGPGAVMWGIGRWNQRTPRAATASPIRSTFRAEGARCSTRVTTAAAPQSFTASRSVSRSRAQDPLIARAGTCPGKGQAEPAHPRAEINGGNGERMRKAGASSHDSCLVSHCDRSGHATAAAMSRSNALTPSHTAGSFSRCTISS